MAGVWWCPPGPARSRPGVPEPTVVDPAPQEERKAVRTKTPTRCKICGGFHTPKCRRVPRGMDDAIWYAILARPAYRPDGSVVPKPKEG